MANDDNNGPGGEPHRFQDWAEDMIKYLAEDIRETKKLTKETRRMAIAAEKKADAAWEQVTEAKRQADAAWELVIITRNEANARNVLSGKSFWGSKKINNISFWGDRMPKRN